MRWFWLFLVLFSLLFLQFVRFRLLNWYFSGCSENHVVISFLAIFSRLSLPVHLLFELGLELDKLIWLCGDAVADVLCDLLRDDAWVQLEEVEVSDFGVVEVAAEACDVDLA